MGVLRSVRCNVCRLLTRVQHSFTGNPAVAANDNTAALSARGALLSAATSAASTKSVSTILGFCTFGWRNRLGKGSDREVALLKASLLKASLLSLRARAEMSLAVSLLGTLVGVDVPQPIQVCCSNKLFASLISELLLYQYILI